MSSRLISQSFRIDGDVSAARFEPWIANHAAKLGIRLQGIQHRNDGLVVEALGAEEMLEALRVACLLGPSCVMVKEVTLLTS